MKWLFAIRCDEMDISLVYREQSAVAMLRKLEHARSVFNVPTCNNVGRELK